MFQAIETKYHGPSNIKGARVSATAAAGRIILSWNHALNFEDNHEAAAKAFADKFEWSGRWFGGATKSGYCFVSSEQGIPTFVTHGRQAA